MEIDLRPALDSDYDYCKLIYFEGMHAIIEALGLDRAQQALGFRQQWVRNEVSIIWVDGVRTGWLQRRDEPDAIFLGQLFVDGPFQRRGIGTAIMQRLIAEASHLRRTIQLNVVKINPALRLYQRLRFRTTHEDEFKFYMTRDPGV